MPQRNDIGNNYIGRDHQGHDYLASLRRRTPGPCAPTPIDANAIFLCFLIVRRRDTCPVSVARVCARVYTTPPVEVELLGRRDTSPCALARLMRRVSARQARESASVRAGGRAGVRACGRACRRARMRARVCACVDACVRAVPNDFSSLTEPRAAAITFRWVRAQRHVCRHLHRHRYCAR